MLALPLRIAKYKGDINLVDYRAVLLASLRSLVPKDCPWNAGRMIRALMGKPAPLEKALDRLWSTLGESSQAMVRREAYAQKFSPWPQQVRTTSRMTTTSKVTSSCQTT